MAMEGLVRGCRWVSRLAALNLLWIGFTLLGLVVAGVMPATAAVFSVLRRWERGESDVGMVRRFWMAYREEFRRANVLGYLLAGLGYLLYTDYAVARSQSGMVHVALGVLFISLSVCYVVVVLFAFPLLVHVRLSIGGYLRWSLALGLGRPLLSVAGCLGAGLLVWAAAHWVPLPVLVFWGISVPAWLMSWCANRAIRSVPALAPDAIPRVGTDHSAQKMSEPQGP